MVACKVSDVLCFLNSLILNMISLNLPPFEYKVKKADGKVLIFDVLRKKYVVLTPEEWVRQHFIHFMTGQLKYPKSLIRIETGLLYNTLHKRCDITVFNRSGNPWLIVECKSPELSICNDTLRQASVYNLAIKARYVVLTNGLNLMCLDTQTPEKQPWKILHELPAYDSQEI